MADRHDYYLFSAVPFGVVSLVMFGLSSHEGRKANQLRQARILASVSDAINLSNILPVLIAVRGKTGSTKPLRTKLKDSFAVMIEESAEWNALKQTEKGIWLPESEVFEHVWTNTDWHITDGKTRLGVESSNSAAHIERTLVTSRIFKEGESNTYKKMMNRLSGYQPLGVWKTEKSLPVGTVVTVVGELAKSFNGDESMIIQKPSNAFNGKPFYITNQTFEELSSSVTRNVGTYKWLGVGFGTISLILMGVHVWKHIRSGMKYRRIRKQIEEENRRRREQSNNDELPPPRRRLQMDVESERRGKCIVCWDQPANAVFIPCGHLCACLTCCEDIKRCPVCRHPCSVYKVFFV
eukprot:g4019.t1